ncbi:MAG: CBS domain-containing protein [Desulfobacteraceae bacterium]|nr:CBS domain-containing protein [Desulfobacteraceae bacterium]
MSKQTKTPITGETIITTHVNADFDALASMLAAQKLYPGSLVVFPGTQEKNLRNFFIQSMVYLFNIIEMKDIDVARIKKLVLVDTRQANRIGQLADLLDTPGIEIHTYDHHPPKKNDIRGQLQLHALTGATITILTEVIKKKGIPITPDEATIMCLGIYEDTGSFTFPSTTERDFQAAAFLLRKGANINIISNMVSREITPEQVSLLNDMIQSATYLNINGVDLVVTNVKVNQYQPDFAFLVHKMVKMENINAIFAIALMENKVYVVARSRNSDIDVGKVISDLGGGGHPSAASASIKGKTLAQVEQHLIKILSKTVKPKHVARTLMSSPPIKVLDDKSCVAAKKLLTRYNINALLVITSNNGVDNLVGYITRQVIEKAIFHKLGKLPVREYMTTEFNTATADANLPEIQEKIIGSKQRILPIVDQKSIVGVITRTDLLNILVSRSHSPDGKSFDPTKETVIARTRRIKNFMHERLSNRIIDLLESLGKVADELGYNAFTIGGFVRDLFLYRKNEDIDIVIEGDGIKFAKTYADLADARIHAHKKFGTAVIILPDGFKIDIASARMEYYRFPAALPDVEMSTIKFDLYRRDFTVNTLAIQINATHFGRLIDFFSAQKDLKDRVIRVLHNLSFVEDPTRVFRAIRFEQRFEFTIGKLTSSLIKNAVKMDFFKRLSGRRVFSELNQILEEEDPIPAIARLNDYQLLTVIDPSIKLDKALLATLSSVKEVIAWKELLFLEEEYAKWTVYFMALIRAFDHATSRNICARLELAPRHCKIVTDERLEAERCLADMEQMSTITNSQLYGFLAPFKIELLLYMMTITQLKRIKKAISFFYTQLRGVKLQVTGQDLMALGIKPGPIYRQSLNAVLGAKLDGKVKTRTEELAYMTKFLTKASNLLNQG